MRSPDFLRVASLEEARAALVVDTPEPEGLPQIRLIGDRNPLGFRRLEPTFRLSEPGYALVVAVDLDRQVQVVYPAHPAGVAVRVQAETSYHTMKFFAGFGRPSANPSYARFASFTPAFERLDAFDGGGVLIAVASDQPLDVSQLMDGDDWDDAAIEELVFGSNVGSAARRLGHAVVAPGQHFTTDVSYLQDQSVTSFGRSAFRGLQGCSDFGAVSANRGFGVSGYVVARYVVNNQQFVRLANDDGCGNVTFVDLPAGKVLPLIPRDTTKADSAHANPMMQRMMLDDARRARIERLRERVDRTTDRASERLPEQRRADSQQRTEAQQRAHEAQMRQALERRWAEERRATSADRSEQRMEPTRVDVGGSASKAEPSRPVAEP